MTNEFSILWFEDNSNWFNMQSRKVEKTLMSDYCLKTKIKRNTGSDFEVEALHSDNAYDIILMDYKLAAGNTGEKIIESIRNNSILTDVLLYSSEYDDMTTALLSERQFIDGVYFADRKNELFETKLYGIIKKIIRRSEDIVNLRGFFLDNTSDFEVRIKEILNISWNKLESEHDNLNSIMNETLDKIINHDHKLVSKLKEQNNIFPAVNNHKYALSIRNRTEILDYVIKKMIEVGHVVINENNKELENFSTNYNDAISVYRNTLSHKKFSDTSIQINGKIISVDDELYKLLRNSINKYDFLITILEDAVTSI